MRNSSDFKGTGVAMVTPFTKDGSLDIPALEKHTEFLINKGVDYLVVLGTTAETPVLSTEEKLKIIEVVRSINNSRVPMVVGAGGNNTSDVIQWIEKTGSNGIDAYLSVVPYYNKPSQTGIKEHFSAIAASSDLPLMLYNVPGRTGCNMTAQTVLELAHEQGEKMIAVKEASGDFGQIMTILKDKPEDFKLISGDDAVALPIICLGGAGIVSVIGNALPELLTGMISNALKGDLDKARETHYSMLPLIELIFREGNPTGVKALMEILGLGDNNLRLPLIPATSALKTALQSAAREL